MDVLVERCAGLDVHRDTVVATVRVPADGDGRRVRRHETRTFTTTTAGVIRLADWLAAHGVTRAGIESTGVYWKPVYYLLEDQVEVWLLNAEHLHNVPGRKTDVADSLWIATLIEHGLVRPSAASGNLCLAGDLPKSSVVLVAVPPGDVAADHAGLFFVAGVVGAVEGEVTQRGELRLDAVQP